MSQPTTSPFKQRRNTRDIIADVVAEELQKERLKMQAYFDSASDNDLLKLAHSMTGVINTPIEDEIGKDIVWQIHLELERRDLIKNFMQCFYERAKPIYGTVDYPRANE